ncbi:ABC transporter permease [Rhodococcus spelaei]|uniref:ABC transporter permease n=1 Tax=Rhodococcus spelaei TaxID=2546320 RepID=A0A541BAV6_9NOCA|nr:ABC transporter permease [Rhodococcus spelaei]TQF69475.1 ABC transporter permease [Rhodococcus spelaei]
MIVKEFRELGRDRRTLAMLVALPLLLLVVFGFAANFTVSTLDVTVVGPGADAVASRIASDAQTAQVLHVSTVDPSGTDATARDALRDDVSDLAIVTGSGKPMVYIDGSNLFAAQSAKIAVAKMGPAVESEVLYNPDLKTSWVMVPAIIGLILTFIGTIITSIGLVKEREAGTLEQLAVMPFSPAEVILGKITPYFLLAALDMIVVTVLGMWIFSVPFNGNVLIFALGAAIFLFVVLGIGVFISTISKTTGQAIQAAMMVLLPQILLSGMIFPLNAMAAGVRWIGYLLPLTYFTKISQGVMLRGAGLNTLWGPIVVLIVMAVVIFGAAVVRLKRSIAPAGKAVVRSAVA